MARSGLSKFEVKEARDFLVSQGRHPSVDAIRVVLGNTGSKSTIHKHLKELEKEAGKANDRQAEIAGTLQDIVEQLAAKLHADAETRIEAMQAAHDIALQRKTGEIETLQKQIDRLAARLEEVEAAARNDYLAQELHREDIRQKPAKPFGSAFFGAFFNTGRDSRANQSLFSSLLNGSRSTINVLNDVQLGEYQMLSRSLLPS